MSDSSIFRAVSHCFRTVSLVVVDLVRLAFLAARSHRSLAAENLFLRKQLALFMANSKIMRRLESDTTLDNVYATGRTRNRLVTPVR